MRDCAPCHSSLVASQSRVRSFWVMSSGVREKQLFPAAASYVLICLKAVSASLNELLIFCHSVSVSRPVKVASLASGFGAYEFVSDIGSSIVSIRDSASMWVWDVLMTVSGAVFSGGFVLRRVCVGVVGSSEESSVDSDHSLGWFVFLFLVLGVSVPLSAPTDADAIRETWLASFLVGEVVWFLDGWVGGLSYGLAPMELPVIPILTSFPDSLSPPVDIVDRGNIGDCEGGSERGRDVGFCICLHNKI